MNFEKWELFSGSPGMLSLLLANTMMPSAHHTHILDNWRMKQGVNKNLNIIPFHSKCLSFVSIKMFASGPLKTHTFIYTTALFISIIEKKSKAPSSNSIISNTSTSSGISSKKANEATIPEISTQPVVCDKDHIASVSVPTTLGVELVSKVRDRYDIVSIY